MIVAFDYDGVSSDIRVQRLIKKMVNEKNEVWIVTMRRQNDFSEKEITPLLQKIGLTKYNVIFCNNKPKLEMTQLINADVYVDNVDTEFSDILNYSHTIPLLFKS